VFAVLAYDREEFRVSVALMQEHRLLQVHGEIELSSERGELRVSRREISKVVQPALADGDHLAPFGKRPELDRLRVIQVTRMVRVDTGGASKALRGRTHQLDGSPRACERAAGDDHACNGDSCCTCDHFFSVVIEAVVREVDTDIDERRRFRRSSDVRQGDLLDAGRAPREPCA
jgi:hypothetical protein